MPASALITFDTQAPVITWGLPSRVAATEVKIPYEWDEEIFGASYGIEVLGQGVVSGDIYPDYILAFDVPETNPVLRVSTTAKDDVNNQASYSADMPITDFMVMARVMVFPILRATKRVRKAIEGQAGVFPALRGEQRLRKAVDAILRSIKRED